MSTGTKALSVGFSIGLLTLAGCSSSGSNGDSNKPINSGVDQTCAKMYTMLAKNALASKTLPKTQVDAWATSAKESAAAAREKDGAKAHQICEQVVSEMTAAGVPTS